MAAKDRIDGYLIRKNGKSYVNVISSNGPGEKHDICYTGKLGFARSWKTFKGAEKAAMVAAREDNGDFEVIAFHWADIYHTDKIVHEDKRTAVTLSTDF